MPAFIFVSGYFFNRPNNIKDIIRFIKKKSKNLLIPFYKYNFIISLIWLILSLFISSELLRTNGIETDISKINFASFIFQKFIIIPFSYGTPFDLISPSWFLISLWGTICSYIVISLFFKNNELISEVMLLCILFILGLFSILLSKIGFSNRPEFILSLKVLFFYRSSNLGIFFNS